MSGRGNPRGRSRSRKRTGNKSQNTKKKPEEKEYKFAVMSTANSTKYYPFDTVKKHFVSKLKENPAMLDVAESIHKEKPLDMTALKPVRQTSNINVFAPNGDIIPQRMDERQIEQKGYDISFEQAEVVWNKRNQEYLNGKVAAYSKIMNHFTTKNIKSKVEQLENFEHDIENDPIALMQALKTLAHDGSAVTYKWKTVWNAHQRLSELRMDDTESIQEWMQRVKNACDVVESHVGKHWLRAVICEDDDFKAASPVDQLKLCEVAWEELKAYIMLHGAHPLKYKSAKHNLTRDASLKDERYPKTLTAMKDHLGSLPWDQAWYDDKKKKRQERERAQRNNDSDPQIQLAQAGQTGRPPLTCHCCGEIGHTSRKCPKKDQIPYKDWYRNRAIQAFEANAEGASATSTNQTSDDQSTASDRRSETNTNQNQGRSLKDHSNFSVCRLLRKGMKSALLRS